MLQTLTQKLTLEEFLKLPETKPELLQNSADILLVPPFLPELKLTVGDVFSWLKF